MYYWSKYCLKRYILRLVLKAGKEGLWQSERRRQFQICAAEKQNTWPPCCFLLKVGVQKILSSREECRDLEGTEIWFVRVPTGSSFNLQESSSGGIANRWTFVYFSLFLFLYFLNNLLSILVPFIFEPCQIQDVSVFCVVLSQHTSRDPASYWMFLFLSQFVLVWDKNKNIQLETLFHHVLFCLVHQTRDSVVSPG